MWISSLPTIKYKLRPYSETTEYTGFYSLTSFSNINSPHLCPELCVLTIKMLMLLTAVLFFRLLTCLDYHRLLLYPAHPFRESFPGPTPLLQAGVTSPSSSHRVLSRFLSLLLTALSFNDSFMCLLYGAFGCSRAGAKA